MRAWALAAALMLAALQALACDDDPLPDLPAPAARLNDDADAPPLPEELRVSAIRKRAVTSHG